MSLNVGTLAGTLELDASPFDRGLDRAMASGAQKASQLGDKMSAAITLPLVAAAGIAIKSASDLQQAVGGTEAVFGDAGEAINDYAKSAARASGLSEREFREATTSIGGQLKRMTGDVDLAAEQSMKLTEVAADLAATYGGTTAEAVAALGSAFRGEADPAERFNLNLKMGAVNAKAVEMGLAATTSEVDENARAQATLALIVEQSADAQGQFAREAGSAAGSMQIAKAEMENVSAEIGSALLPLVTDLAGGVADLASSFSDLPDPVQKGVLAFAGLLAVTGPLLSMGGRMVTNWGKIAAGFDKGATAASNLAGKLNLAQAGAVGLAAVAVGAAVNAWAREMNEASDDAEEFVETFAGASVRPVQSMGELHDEIMRVGAAAAEMKRRGDEAINPFLKDRLRGAEEGLNGVRDQLLQAEGAAAKLQAELGITADEAAAMATNEELMAQALDKGTGELDAQAAAAEAAAAAQKEMESAIRAVTDAIRSQLDPLFAAQDSMLAHKDAQDAVKAAQLEALVAQQELDEAIREHGRESDEAALASLNLATAQEELKDANSETARTALDVAAAAAELTARVRENPEMLAKSEAQLRLWVQQGLLTEEQAHQIAGELRGVSGEADRIAGRNVTMSVGLTGFSAVVAQLDELSRRAGTPLLLNASISARERAEGRWTGGPVMPDKEYIIGENGEPELLLIRAA